MFLKNGKPRIVIDSITPDHGPSTGGTKVMVRGGPFAQFQNDHPEPVCKFGDARVAATYVQCPPRAKKAYEREGGHWERTALCIQCEDSPKLATEALINITFSLSLDGTFEDVKDTAEYWYHKPIKVKALKPKYGPKDGGTTVQVWGENFIE